MRMGVLVMTAPAIPTTGDPIIDLAVDMLSIEHTDSLMREIVRRRVAEALRDKPNRIDGGAR